jgi:phospholipase/carboxylesterase
LWRRAKRRGPLVLLLHGHGVDEHDIFPLEALFPADASVAALRAPVPSEGGYRWYAHHDVGRPIASSLADGMRYVGDWLAAQPPARIWLVGFSGGGVMAGALLLSAPDRFAGVAMLHGTLPFDAGIAIDAGRLAGCEVFYGYGENDPVIPPGLTERSRTYLRDESGARVEIHGYRAAHELPAPEQRDLTSWYAGLT